MDLASIPGLSRVSGTSNLDPSTILGTVTQEKEKTDGVLFDTFLNTAIDNIRETNNYLSKAEDEKIKFALGETDNAHDLGIALQKASSALQYTIAVRDKLMEAYRELMQMQI